MRRNAIVSCAVFVLLLTGFAAGAAACQITCPDGSSCSILIGTCQCFNDGHAYCFPDELNFAGMTQLTSLSIPSAPAEASTRATIPTSLIETGAPLAFQGAWSR